MSEWCAERTSEEAVRELEAARIPAGPVNDPAAVLADPHVKARELFKYTDYPGLPKPAPLADTPVRLSETPGGIRSRPPTLGEHTDRILDELGFNAADIAGLREAGVI